MSVTLRYAEGDDDVVAIHRFLCVVAGPTLPGPIDARDSITEIWRVVNDDVALMALDDENKLVGTLGLMRPSFWWNGKLGFLVNRWLFTLPASRAAKPLLKEARAIATASELDLHIIDEERQRLVVFKHRQ